jgi:murein DD-endopeptidase MepM/ murein hydrolase activator NlpD
VIEEREPTVPVASSRRFDGRRVAGTLGPSRAAVLVAALVAGSVGHVLLPAAAGARPPAHGAGVPAETFRPLDLGADGATGTWALDERAAGEDAAMGADFDAWGLPLAVNPGSPTEPAATLVSAPPEVVRFRPRDGWTDVDRNAQLSVRFTTAMDHATSEAAFHATLDGADMTGSVRWAEGDTVLVLRPSTAMPYGARVELRVDGGAISATGSPLESAASVHFTVQSRPVAPTTSGPSSSGWGWPLIGPITQSFGQALTEYGFHQGIDIDGDTGDQVKAARSGVVVVAGVADECGGLQVRIDHGDGLLTWYRHLSAIETAVGARVAVGTVVGRVGNTGCSLGSHLHFGVSLNGEFVDPIRYLPPR